jgi:hypothetical protein
LLHLALVTPEPCEARSGALGGQQRRGAWVHAHLHRVEGDLANACYWYRQARRRPATGDLATEWATIAATLLASKRA